MNKQKQKQLGQVSAWINGKLEKVYFKGPKLHGSRSKYFIRDRQQNKVKSIYGKLYQNQDTAVPYFIANS